METKEIEALIRFHEAGLSQYRQYIDPASQYLEEQTIKALEELKGKVELANKANEAVREARNILERRQAKQGN